MSRDFRRKKDLFHDFTDSKGVEWRRTPRQFIKSIEFAQNELSYSNYDCHNLECIKEIVYRYCREHKIPLGPSDKQIENIRLRSHDKQMKNLENQFKLISGGLTLSELEAKNNLEYHVDEHEKSDCIRTDTSLGFKKMPIGYALMLDHDGMYFYWLKFDGTESSSHWDKWAVYRGAKLDAQKKVGK